MVHFFCFLEEFWAHFTYFMTIVFYFLGDFKGKWMLCEVRISQVKRNQLQPFSCFLQDSHFCWVICFNKYSGWSISFTLRSSLQIFSPTKFISQLQPSPGSNKNHYSLIQFCRLVLQARLMLKNWKIARPGSLAQMHFIINFWWS